MTLLLLLDGCGSMRFYSSSTKIQKQIYEGRVDSILLSCICLIYQINRYLTNMSYLQRALAEEPLKNSQKVNKLQIPNSSYLKSFKKTIGGNVTKLKTEPNQQSFASDENGKPIKIQQRNRINSKTKSQTQQNQNQNQFDQFHYVMQETDNSMEELLNSSINQFEKLIIHEESGESLEEQNYRLKNALSKMKNILRDKLEIALQKQKEQLSKMLEDYISLITKLLQDKEELTIKIQDLAEDNSKKMKQMEMEYSKKLRVISEERDEQIGSTKNQIEEFLGIIEQYEEEAKQEQTKFAEMQDRIEALEEERDHLIQQVKEGGCENDHENHDDEMSLRIQAQSTKIQTLLELLQKIQLQNNELKAEINQLKAKQYSYRNMPELKQLKDAYERQIAELNQEHLEEFLEYEKAIQDTLQNKEECIERLNLIIEGLRERKTVS